MAVVSGRDQRPCWSAAETRGLASSLGKSGTGSGTIPLRGLKPDPMPAADRDGQPYRDAEG